MGKWILGLMVCVAMSGCMGCDKDDVAGAITSAEQKAEDLSRSLPIPTAALTRPSILSAATHRPAITCSVRLWARLFLNLIAQAHWLLQAL